MNKKSKKEEKQPETTGFLGNETGQKGKLSHRDLTGLAGAGSAMIGGAGAEEAVGLGIAARGFAGHVNADLAYRIELSKKIAAEPNCWKRMKLRVIG